MVAGQKRVLSASQILTETCPYRGNYQFQIRRFSEFEHRLRSVIYCVLSGPVSLTSRLDA